MNISSFGKTVRRGSPRNRQARCLTQSSVLSRLSSPWSAPSSPNLCLHCVLKKMPHGSDSAQMDPLGSLFWQSSLSCFRASPSNGPIGGPCPLNIVPHKYSTNCSKKGKSPSLPNPVSGTIPGTHNITLRCVCRTFSQKWTSGDRESVWVPVRWGSWNLTTKMHGQLVIRS